MDRATLRSELVGLVGLAFVLGMFVTNALARASLFAPDKAWWVYALGANFMFVCAYSIVARIRRILAHAEAREASITHPVA